MGGANVGYRLLALASPLMRFSGLPLVPAPGKRDSPAVVSESPRRYPWRKKPNCCARNDKNTVQFFF
jgi:hypothetical protein